MGRRRKELPVRSLSGRRIRTVVGVSVSLPPILQFTLTSSWNRSLGVSFGFSGFPEKQEKKQIGVFFYEQISIWSDQKRLKNGFILIFSSEIIMFNFKTNVIRFV